MLFSIVTVTYNASQLLKRTIDSVLGQASESFEYLIVDGKSEDGTVEIIKSYEDKLSYWSSEKDTGIYNAMNKALQHCKGEWVIFMNAGDTFSDNSILKQIAPHCLPHIDLIYGDRHRISPSGLRRYEKAGRLEDAYLKEVVYHQSLFTRTELLRQRNYDESYKLAADYEFMLHSLKSGKKFKYVELSVSDFLEGGASRENYLLAQIEAIKAALHHSPEKSTIHKNYYLENLVVQNMGRIFNERLQASKRLNPSLQVEAVKLGKSIDIRASHSNAQLDDILNRINTALSADNISELNSYPIKKVTHHALTILRRIKRYIKRKASAGRALNSTATLAPSPRPTYTNDCSHDEPAVVSSEQTFPKVTVVTVCYNSGDALLETILSVSSQNYEALEYIVIDGASTDRTSEILKQHSNKITKIVSEPDNGIYDAMNKAIDLATGEYTIFMNAGDTFYSADSVLSALSKNTKSFDLIYGARIYSDQDKQRTYQEARPLETALIRMPYCHQSLFLKTIILREYSFNTTYRFAADYEQSVRLLMARKSYLMLSEPVCIFSAGGASESGIRPYLETIKILMDNCKDKETIKRNVYYSSFTRNASHLLDI